MLDSSAVPTRAPGDPSTDGPPPDPYYEDFRVGQRVGGPARELPAVAVAEFAAVSGDRSPIHLRSGLTPGSRPLVHGALVLSGFFGWFHEAGLGTHVEAALDVDWDFLHPVYSGDSVTYEMTVTRCRRTSAGRRGIVGRHVTVRNQDGVAVQEGRTTMLVTARDTTDDGSRAGIEFPTLRWSRLLADGLAGAAEFREAAGTWDGTIGLRFGTDVVLLRVYRGQVIDTGARTPHGPTFVLGASDVTWARLLTGPRNDFVERTLRDEFSTTGDTYEYLRLTRAVVALIDEARALAARARRGEAR